MSFTSRFLPVKVKHRRGFIITSYEKLRFCRKRRTNYNFLIFFNNYCLVLSNILDKPNRVFGVKLLYTFAGYATFIVKTLFITFWEKPR